MADKMREKNVIILCGLILIICGIFLWPTLYRYDKTEARLVKINRITGYTQVLEREKVVGDIIYVWYPNTITKR
jgi:hypothetical protein